MSKSKIDSWEATRLGEAIAAKAFEHLTSPITVAISTHLRECYHKLIPKKSYAYLLERGVVDTTSGITFNVPYGACTCSVDVKGDTDEFMSGRGYGNEFAFHDESEAPQFAELQAALEPILAKQEVLAKELANQLLGQSAAKAIKAWPEAEKIIRKYFNMEAAPVDMVKPLEVLLAKFMPALPAPTEVTE